MGRQRREQLKQENLIYNPRVVRDRLKPLIPKLLTDYNFFKLKNIPEDQVQAMSTLKETLTSINDVLSYFLQLDLSSFSQEAKINLFKTTELERQEAVRTINFLKNDLQAMSTKIKKEDTDSKEIIEALQSQINAYKKNWSDFLEKQKEVFSSIVKQEIQPKAQPEVQKKQAAGAPEKTNHKNINKLFNWLRSKQEPMARKEEYDVSKVLSQNLKGVMSGLAQKINGLNLSDKKYKVELQSIVTELNTQGRRTASDTKNRTVLVAKLAKLNSLKNAMVNDKKIDETTIKSVEKVLKDTLGLSSAADKNAIDSAIKKLSDVTRESLEKTSEEDKKLGKYRP